MDIDLKQAYFANGMMTKSPIFLKKLTGSLLILVMGGLMLNQAFYTHGHLLNDGSIVSHAHPFSKSQESKKDTPHKHSTLELYLIQNLQLLYIVTLVLHGLLLISVKYQQVQPAGSAYVPVDLTAMPGRAPPADI